MTAYLGSTLVWGGGGLNPPSIVDQRLDTSTPFEPLSASVTAGGSPTAHTKGSAWTEIVASTAADADLLYVAVQALATSSQSGAALADIAIGGAGSESIIVANLNAGSGTAIAGGNIMQWQCFPVHIPSGSRLSMKLQKEYVGANNVASVVTQLGTVTGFTSPSTVTALNANTSTSGGTVLTTAGTAYEIIASTAANYQGLTVGFSCAKTAMFAGKFMAELGIGGAGAETWYRIESMFATHGNEFLGTARMGAYGNYLNVAVPSGSRVAARITGANASQIQAVVHGVPT